MSLKQHIKSFLEQQELDPNRKFHIFFIGKLRPFHKGHKATYDFLRDSITINNLNGTVYVGTKLKDDDFLTAEQQQTIIELSGIPRENIINYSGYNIRGLLRAVDGTEDDVVITSFSQKDLEDGSKTGLISLPKDNITAWKRIEDLNDIKWLRPVSFIHKRYQDIEERKRQKGTGYVVVTPTQSFGNIIMSSSYIRQQIAENNWGAVAEIVVNQEVLEYLKKIKEKK